MTAIPLTGSWPGKIQISFLQLAGSMQGGIYPSDALKAPPEATQKSAEDTIEYEVLKSVCINMHGS